MAAGRAPDPPLPSGPNLLIADMPKRGTYAAPVGAGRFVGLQTLQKDLLRFPL